MRMRTVTTGMLILSLAMLGCDKPKEQSKPSGDVPAKGTADNDKHDDHDHGEGPNGGVVFDLAKTHAEFVVDHKKKEVTVYLHTMNMKKRSPIKAEKLTLSIVKPAFTVDMVAKPDEKDDKGTSSRFVAVDDRFGVEQEFEGTVTVELDGKPFTGKFKEEPHDHEKKDKK